MITHVLGLSGSDFATPSRLEYNARLDDDTRIGHDNSRVDGFAGHLTCSFVETFYLSGTLGTHLGEFYGGLRYNADSDRVIRKVTGLRGSAGSGGVTRVDLRKIAAGSLPTTNESAFSDNVFKLIMSSSLAAGDVAESSVFAAGSSSWSAGEILGVVVESAESGAPTDMIVQVHWMPSASYG